jgi:CBS domain-containing protein
MLCNEIMSRDVVSLRPGDKVDSAARRMRDRNVGFAPVCGDDGKPVGAVTDRDIAIRICAQDRRAGRTHVEDIMTRELLTCRETDDIERAEALMAERHKSRIILLDPRGLVAGVLSVADIAEHEEDTRAMRMIRRILEREVRGAAREPT